MTRQALEDPFRLAFGLLHQLAHGVQVFPLGIFESRFASYEELLRLPVPSQMVPFTPTTSSPSSTNIPGAWRQYPQLEADRI